MARPLPQFELGLADTLHPSSSHGTHTVLGPHVLSRTFAHPPPFRRIERELLDSGEPGLGPIINQEARDTVLDATSVQINVRIQAVSYTHLDVYKRQDSHWLERLRRETAAFTNLYRELELDAVVVNTAVVYPASAAALRVRVPLLVHCHGPLLPRAFPNLDMAAWHSLDVLQSNMADMVLTPSRWVYDYLRTVCKVPESRLRVLFNGCLLYTSRCV